MDFKLSEYEPIDYHKWILGAPAISGANLTRLGLLNDMESKIMNEATPFQDKRDDPGQGETVTYFAVKLLDYMPGNRDIAVPAAMLHDTGWHGNDPQAWKRMVDAARNDLKSLDDESKRRPHQNRGCLIAGKVLGEVGYFDSHPDENWLEIADIIGDHDTRKLPTTDSGRVMRAADLLWRVTLPHAQLYFKDEEPGEILYRLNQTFFTDDLSPHLGEVGEQIGRVELANTMVHNFGSDSYDLLKDDFGPELDRITDFYS